MDATQPWEQRDGEPNLWFDRFTQFRLMGPARTFAEVYRKCVRTTRKGAKGRGTSGLPRNWREEIERWEWKARVEAWDKAERERLAREYERDLELDRYARVALLKKFRAKLEAAVEKLKPDEVKYGDVSYGLQVVTRELRVEFEQEPMTQVQVNAMDADELAKLLKKAMNETDAFEQALASGAPPTGDDQ